RDAVKGTSQGLAIDGDPFDPQTFTQGVDPALEAHLEGCGVQQAEEAAEGVVRGDAVGQTQESLEPVLLGKAILGDIHPAFGSADDGTDSDDDDIHEVVQACAVDPWIFEGCEVALNRQSGVAASHPVPP